jgi:hypothetical protein
VPDGRQTIGKVTSGAAAKPVPPPPPKTMTVVIDTLVYNENLELLDTEEGAIRWAPAPGANYTVIVQVRPAEQGEPNPVVLVGSATVAVEWTGDAAITLERQSLDLNADSFKDGQESPTLTLTLQIPATASKAEGELVLRYHGPRIQRTSKVLGALRTTGAHRAASKKFLDTVNIALAADRNPDIAILHIGAGVGNRKLQVSGYHACDDQDFEATITELEESLADVDDENPSLIVAKAVRGYNRNLIAPLAIWLESVFARTQKKVSLVLVEHVESRVPWEMLVLEPKKGVPIGAMVPIVRWTTVGLVTKKLELDPLRQDSHKGSVLNFVDQAALPNSKVEADALDACKGERFTDLGKFREGIKKPPNDLAAVFLSCHGIFAQDEKHKQHIKLVDQKNPRNNWQELDLVLPELPPEPPMMIVNACHSARILRINDSVAGLPEFFLAEFARSYLGTLGAVDEEFAAEVGKQLIEEACSPEGVNIPDFLLRLRRKEAQAFNGAQFARRYVSAFMYVFYGPLHSHLKLEKK